MHSKFLFQWTSKETNADKTGEMRVQKMVDSVTNGSDMNSVILE